MNINNTMTFLDIDQIQIQIHNRLLFVCLFTRSVQVAGKYIKEYIGEKFDRYYTSEYVRAMETAALLDLPNARWYTEIVLRERDKGPLDNTSIIERNEKWAEEMERRKRDR
jgi:broad specificity phosphatase PhoE